MTLGKAGGAPGRTLPSAWWLLPLVSLIASACASATMIDARLTAAGRAATPLARQSPAQHVEDMTECREEVMDRLFYAGAYVLYNPFRRGGGQAAMSLWHQRFADCLRGRGYSIPTPSPQNSPGR